MHKISVLALTIGALAIGAAPAAAVPIEWNAGAGTWTTPLNWLPVQVPLAGDDASINKGGVASQSGLPITVRDLNIGHRINGVLAPANLGTGTVNLTNGNATISRDLRVGVTDAGIGNGSSNGNFITSGIVSAPGNVTVGNNLFIGSFINGGTGTARGNVDIQNGGLTGSSGLVVGLTNGAGNGDGTLMVEGDVSGFMSHIVGTLFSGASGDATGNLDIQNGDLLVGGGSLQVGTSSGSGTANGTATISGNATSVGGANIGALFGGATAGSATGDLTIDGTYQSGGVTSFMRVGSTFGNGAGNGTAEIGAGISNIEDIFVGFAGSNSTVAASANGGLTVLAGGVQGLGTSDTGLDIGTTETAASVVGTATVTGGISGFTSVDIGLADTGATGNGTGNADILSGGLMGALNGNLNVGRTNGAGNGDGTLTVDGGISQFQNVNIGRADTGLTGNATGNVDIQSGGLTGSSGLVVGLINGAGNGDGTLTVEGDVSGFMSHIVGTLFSGASGDATGNLDIQNGDLFVGGGSLQVGTSNGSGTANGTATISGNATSVGGANIGTLFGNATAGSATGDLTVGGALQGDGAGSLIRLGTTFGNGAGNGTAEIGGGISNIENILIGFAGPNSTALGTAMGDLTVLAGGVQGLGTPSSALDIGTTETAASVVGTATVTGGISGFTSVDIGLADTGATGNGTGNADILSGGLMGALNGNLNVGRTNGAGNGGGTLTVDGGISQFQNVNIGFADSGASGNATGTADIQNGGLTGTVNSAVVIGRTNGAGNGDGTLTVDGNVSGFLNHVVGTIVFGAAGDATGNLDIQNGDLLVGGGGLSVGTSNGSGTANGTATISGNATSVSGASIGTLFGNATGGTATGDLTVGGALQGDGAGSLIRLGTTFGNGAGNGTAEIGGGISNIENVLIGFAGPNSTALGTAMGDLTVLAGGVQGLGTLSSALDIGTTETAASVVGTATVTGGISGFQLVNVGVVASGASGNATGSLTVNNGNFSANTLLVGTTSGTGTAMGTFNLNDNLGIIDNAMVLGDGSTVALGIGGLMRGMEYGAIDADFTILGGILDLAFSFMPTDGDIFDLIISGSDFGIANDFDTVNFFGLAPGTLATYGIVVDNVNGTDVEIWRLEIGTGDPIPDPPVTVAEPGTLVILVSGLMVLGVARRRRRTNVN